MSNKVHVGLFCINKYLLIICLGIHCDLDFGRLYETQFALYVFSL